MLFSTLAAETEGYGGEYAWLVWVALAVFVLMVFLGWWVSSKGWLKPEEEFVGGHAHDDHGHGSPDGAASHDDLKMVEGIGPKVAALLNENGVHTFAQLAAADAQKLNSVLSAAGYGYMDATSWVEQAALAAKGDLAGLKALQETLKGGRKTA